MDGTGWRRDVGQLLGGAQAYKEVKCESDQLHQIYIDTLEGHNRDAMNQINITFFPEATFEAMRCAAPVDRFRDIGQTNPLSFGDRGHR
jgi:hypothetical protein